MRGVNTRPSEPNWDLYQLALRSLVQRDYPNFVNVDWSGRAGFDRNKPSTYAATMGCRTVTGFDINGLGWENDGRGNIAPATIILPTIAMETIEELGLEPMVRRPMDVISDNFFKRLGFTIQDCIDSLKERYEFIISQSLENAKYVYKSGFYAGFDGKTIESALKHGTLGIGQLGLAEALKILIGCDHTEDAGMDLAIEIEKLFRTMADTYKKWHKLNYGVYMTPRHTWAA